MKPVQVNLLFSVSINAALGSKTSPDFIRSGCEYGLSEITFAIPEDKIERIKELGVISCDDGELVISRKIMANRSQIKVNGQSFTSAQTRVLAHELIDIHGQHDNQLLMDESNHLSVIDDYDNSINPLLDSYKECYKEYTICKKHMKVFLVMMNQGLKRWLFFNMKSMSLNQLL